METRSPEEEDLALVLHDPPYLMSLRGARRVAAAILAHPDPLLDALTRNRVIIELNEGGMDLWR